MDTINLQIPVSKNLKISAQETAYEMGFSSLQELIRVILKKVADKTINITLEESFTLSKKAAKRYEKIAKDIEKGVGFYEAKDVDDLMKQLSS